MDVRCQKCGIEYEFDDAKVTTAGVTVKCTSCGHVFKVKREAPVDPMAQFGAGAVPMGDLPRTATATTLPPLQPTGDAEWMVRQQSGTVFRFKELTTLQKWIVERKVGRDDEISKTGRSWKRLGEIAELASFFQVVEAANAALSQSLPAVQPAVASGLQPAMLPAGGPAPGFQVLHQHATGHTQVQMPAVNVPVPHAEAPQVAPAATPTAPPLAMSPNVAVRQPDAQPPPPAAKVQSPPVQKGQTRKLPVEELDDDDPVAEWGRSRRRKIAAAVVLVGLVVMGGVVFAIKPPWLVAMMNGDAAGAALDAPKRALASDDPSEINKALGDDTSTASPDRLAVNAQLWCAQASHAHEVERLHDLLRALEPAQAAAHDAAADKANQAASDALGKAYAILNDVRSKAPDSVEVHLAAASYNVEKGGYAEMKADLESARTAAKPEQKNAVDAEIAVQQAIADGHQALAATDAAALAAASERVPVSTDARLKYVKSALAITAKARAREKAPLTDADRAALQAVAIDHSDERAELLKTIVKLLSAPPAIVDAGVAPVVVVDAGVVVADAGAPAEAETYDSLMAKAERARVGEHAGAARDAFNKALKLKPSSSRAWMGLGWANLDLDKKAEAVKCFRKALGIDDGLSDAHFGLAEALRFSGQKDQALEEYKTYLKMDPSGKDASVAKNAIESLQ